MSLTIRQLDPAVPGEAAAWDSFVAAMAETTGESTFFHRAGWAAVISRAFGQRPHYLYALRDGAICGVLPLVHMRSFLFGRALVSAPFCVLGGPLAADAESAAALDAAAVALRERLGVPVLEYRFAAPPEQGWAAGLVAGPPIYAIFRRPISADDNANLQAIPRKQRAMVRKAMQNGLTSTAGTAPADFDTLFRVYAESVRNLGTPVFPRRYFHLLGATFPDAAEVVTVLDEGRPIAAVLSFHDAGTVLPYYGGGTAAARGRAGNDFMYWEVMRRAAARGAHRFDFGRSKTGTGAFAFKRNWGFEPEPLAYRYRLAPGARIPEHNPLNPKYQLMIAAWKRLPLALANWLGPPIVRGIG